MPNALDILNSSLNSAFDEEQKKTSGSAASTPVTVSTTKRGAVSTLDDILNDTFKESRVPTQQPVVDTPAPTPEKKSGFAGFVTKAVEKIGNFFKPSEKQQDADFALKQIMYGTGNTIVKDPVTGKNKLTNPAIEKYNAATTPDEKAAIIKEQDAQAPLLKFLNSPTGAKVTGAIAENTSNLPLKAVAKIKAIGDDIMDMSISSLSKDLGFFSGGSENYKQQKEKLIAKAKDPNNSRFEKILYGLQDSGVQSAVGALLAVGVSAITRNPKAGQAVAMPYFAAISAESQRQDKGKVDSLGDIAIDTVGDTVISNIAESTLKTIIKEGGEAGFKTLAKEMGKGFLVEGTTEPTQSLLKYANDYKNATSEEERQQVVAETTNYVKSGAMLNEFLIGGLSGSLITGAATGLGNASVNPSLQSEGIKGELNTDFSAIRDEAGKLEEHLAENPDDQNAVTRLTAIQENLNDYQQAVKQRPIYILDSNTESDTPLAVVETVQYPDGKYTYSFNVNAGETSIEAPFSTKELYATKEEAVKAAKDEITKWAATQTDASPEVKDKLDEVLRELGKTQVRDNVKITEKTPEKIEKPTKETPVEKPVENGETATLMEEPKATVKKLSTNVTKAPVGYNVQEYSDKGERIGTKKVKYEKSKKTGKVSIVVYNPDGTVALKMDVERAKKRFDTNDKARLADLAVNGKIDRNTGKWTVRQSNAPVIRNTTQNQAEKKPVKTEGEVRGSRAFARVQARLGEYADMDVNYNRLNLAKDTANALDFIEKNPKESKKIALGLMGAPEGVTETAISIALAEQAAENKDYALQAQLERSRSLRQTRRGQEIVAERGRFNENSAHFFMQQVLKARMEQAGKEKVRFLFNKSEKQGRSATTEAKIQAETDGVKQSVKKKLSRVELAQSIIDNLTC